MDAEADSQKQTPKEALATILSLAREMGRSDFVRLLEAALERTERDEMVVVVVGEFKRGKSSFVNGLLGVDVCPVSPDSSTAVPTALRGGRTPGVALTVEQGSERKIISGALSELVAMVLETSENNAESRRLLAVVDLPNQFLEEGFRIIDCPGVGGLSEGFADAALNIARVADLAIVIADAGAPLDQDTITFIQRLTSRLPEVVIALSRSDLYRHGGALGEVREQLAEVGIESPVFSISNYLRREALRTMDSALDGESGFPALVEELRRQAGARQQNNLDRAISEGQRICQILAGTVVAENELLARPEGDWSSAIARARADLEEARRNAGRWLTILNESISDAVAKAEFESARSLRQTRADFDREIDAASSASLENELWGRVQSRVQGDAGEIAGRLADALVAVEVQLSALFEDEGLERETGGDNRPQVPSLQNPAVSLERVQSSSIKTAVGGVYTGLRGAQSGIILVGVFAGIAGLGLGTLAIAGVGALFGGKQLIDERQRRLQALRQQTRNAMHQLLDEAQAEITRAIREWTRQELRRQRDVFSVRATEFVAARAALELDLVSRQHASREERERLQETLQHRWRTLQQVSKALSGGLRGDFASR